MRKSSYSQLRCSLIGGKTNKNSVSQLTPIINENGLKYVEHEGRILFSSEEIGRQLGYAKPSKSINILFNRNQRELKSYAVGIKMMSTDRKFYEFRCFTEEGVYILSMLANTPQAREFRACCRKSPPGPCRPACWRWEHEFHA